MGVLSHHAATPHGLRLAIEHAMKRGHARFVICTSTLAQGVNFPIRYLVITTTQQGAESIMVRDFHNLMGRAGRAGMHTEGSVIFSSPAIFDERGPQKDGWKWQAAKHLLDADNSEPSRSVLLKLFEPFQQRGVPPVVQPMLGQWLDLAFADQARIDEIVAEALAIQPLISAAQFRPFIEERAHAIQQIAAFLAANMDFDDPAADDRIQELATHTLGYFLATDNVRLALIETFRMIAASIKARADGDLQSIIRRSPLPPSVAAELQAWVAANLEVMNEATLNGTLLDIVGAAVLPHASDRSIRAMSDRAALPRLLAAWADGENYEHLLQILEEDPTLRISNRKPTVEDAVSIGEGGFGYDVAMLVAAITDLVEPIDGNLHAALEHLQKRVKYGLTLLSAIAMYEAGFADRVVATVLGTIWPLALDRAGVRAASRAPNGGMAAALQAYPEYFATVAEELQR
jgi:hypothetical protein